jgi:hypothetical protein
MRKPKDVKWVQRSYNKGLWIGFIWLRKIPLANRIERVGRYRTSGFVKERKFIGQLKTFQPLKYSASSTKYLYLCNCL